MAEDTGQQKHHSDKRTPKRHSKLPLTLHPTGQYCKKIRGKMCYFGRDREKALQLYHEQATSLHTERGVSPTADSDLSLRTLGNLYSMT